MSKVNIKIYGDITPEGTLEVYDKDRFEKYLKTFVKKNGENTKVYIVIKRWYKKRSTGQNEYYWGLVLKMISEEIGMDTEEVHEAMKWMFLRKKGSYIPTVKSTQELTTVEFEEYLSQIRQWASLPVEDEGLGLYIPLPNEVEIDYNNF